MQLMSRVLQPENHHWKQLRSFILCSALNTNPICHMLCIRPMLCIQLVAHHLPEQNVNVYQFVIAH